jgi:hypothetical protein
LTAGWQSFTCENFCKGGLAGAIASDETNAIATIDTDCHIVNK